MTSPALATESTRRTETVRDDRIDLLRGLVMVVMTIDHVREYSAGPGLVPLGDPMDLSQVGPLLFLLRWISHFCAPIFAFLMGVSAWMSSAKRSVGERRRHLVLRGLVLIGLEFTFVNWAWTFNPMWHRYFFQVIAALGVAMVCLGLASGLSRRMILLMGMVLAFGHNAFDWVRFDPSTGMHYAWSFWKQKNVLPLLGGFEVRTTYPVVSVVALAFCGFGLGAWFREPDGGARKLRITGASLCLLFLALRLTNAYGDPFPFEPQSTWLYTFFSVLNTTKYPLSLQFMLMTVGPAMLFLSGRPVLPFPAVVRTLGRVPMFYYIAHLFVAHLLAWSAALLAGYPVSSLNVVARYGGIPQGFGFPLWATLPLSLGLTLLLLPACSWHARLRESRRHSWTQWI
jgi:uncharacterized membrane protein